MNLGITGIKQHILASLNVHSLNPYFISGVFVVSRISYLHITKIFVDFKNISLATKYRLAQHQGRGAVCVCVCVT